MNDQLLDAACEGNNEIVNMMIRFGADKEVRDDWGMTPLQKAAREGHTEIVNLLVNAGADITKEKDFVVGTPLHLAAQKGTKVLDVVDFKGD